MSEENDSTQSSGHSHGHAHGGHGQDGEGPVGAAALSRPDLDELAGRDRWLHFDAPSGIAGDMTVAALVNLGVPFDIVTAAVAKVAPANVSVQVEAVFRGAIAATAFRVRPPAEDRERTLGEILQLLEGSALDHEVLDLAKRIFLRLGHAEAKVHQIELMDVAFHEVGAMDAIVDIVGAAACLRYLGGSVSASPLPVGRGFVECRHGVLPLPAPATLECLTGVPTYDGGVDAELVTPTGAAIISTVATEFCRFPSWTPERVGWGAGSRLLPDRPNALRVILGSRSGSAADVQAGTHVVVEANLDDATGELVGHAMNALLRAGALDVWVTPSTMKKGRPGLVLHGLAPLDQAEALAATMLKETPSIGVRWSVHSRLERPRAILHVDTRFGSVPVKVSAGPHGPPEIKPEFDVCANLAADCGVSVREVIRSALDAAREQIESD